MGWMDEFPMMHPDGAGAANRLLRDAAIRRRVCVQDGFSDERHTRAGGIRNGDDIKLSVGCAIGFLFPFSTAISTMRSLMARKRFRIRDHKLCH